MVTKSLMSSRGTKFFNQLMELSFIEWRWHDSEKSNRWRPNGPSSRARPKQATDGSLGGKSNKPLIPSEHGKKIRTHIFFFPNASNEQIAHVGFFPLYPLEIGSKAVKGSTVTGWFERKCTFLPKIELALVFSISLDGLFCTSWPF